MTYDMNVLNNHHLTGLGGSGPAQGKTLATALERSGQGGKPSPADAAADGNNKPDQGQLDQMVSGLNDLVQELHRELQFTLDKESGEVVIKVIDRQTEEVVRQLPPEEVLRLRERLQKAAGAIFRDTA